MENIDERMHPKHISIDDFTYILPEERIAKFPLNERDQSKLLVWKKGADIREDIFKNLSLYLPGGTLLVFNNSKVIECRLIFQKESGGIIEIFALEPHEKYADISEAIGQTGSIWYKCLVGGASKWKTGMVLRKATQTEEGLVTIKASLIEKRSDCFVVMFEWEPADFTFAHVLHSMGSIPIPPYLQREAEGIDKERYQTVYASKDGSVAAPTAGLHFTPHVMQQLSRKGIQQAYTTLHVGAGTFMPVKSQTMDGHSMHAEFMEVSRELIESVRDARRVIPVGTTSMRTLESLYGMGLKVLHNPNIDLKALELKQWEAYETPAFGAYSKKEALDALINWLAEKGIQKLVARTQILIAPGYTFGICNGLITNFHQPKSTLLLLISALTGLAWKDIYEYALKNDFRFLSYGDSCFLMP